MPISIEAQAPPHAEIFYVNHKYPLKTIRQVIRLEALEQVKAVPVNQKSVRAYRLKLFLKNGELIDMGCLGKIDQASEVEFALKELLVFAH